MKRGEIFLCDFGDPIGSDPGYVRPVVIVQDDRFNKSGIATTVALAMTSQVKYKSHPGCYFIAKEESGLDKDGVINATQMACVDKSQLISVIGSIPDELMIYVENCMKVVLGLE